MKLLVIALISLLALTPAASAQPISVLPTGFVVAEGADFSRLRAAGGSAVKLLADWSVIEPAPGQFAWTALDESIRAATRTGLRVVVVLTYTPKWASLADGPDLTNPAIYRHQSPRRLSDWERFVSQAASRYKGTVKDWQVWTTLSLPLFRGTTKAYISLLRAARAKTKAIDASSRVVLATAYGIDLVSLRQVLIEAPTAFDVISFTPRGMAPEGLLRPLGVVQERLLANQRKAIWIEWDLLSGGFRPTWPAQVLKVAAIARALGVEQVFWVGDAAADTGVLPLFSTRVGGKPFVGYLLTQQALVLLFGDTPAAAVAWTSGGEVPVSFDAQDAAIYAPMGAVRQPVTDGGKVTVRVGPDPVVVTGIGAVSVAQAKSTLQSRGLPVAPASVDYSQAAAVSARLGTKNVEQGLYNMPYRNRRNGAVEVVQIDGAEAVRTNAAKEIVFVYFHVDESFLYYVDGRAKVEISVEVWGAKGPQQLGFNLLYDSMTGYRFTPWQWVDAKDGWATYTFPLTDANFSGPWGWDFAINAGGNRSEDLTVRTVTVRKIPTP